MYTFDVKKYGHTTEFWDNMRFLLKKGIELKVYKHIDAVSFQKIIVELKLQIPY